MPELPEVETMVRDLRERITGRTIEGVDLPFPGELRYPDPAEFRDRVCGRIVNAVSRRAKFAVFHLDSSDVLILHRGMSGSVLLRIWNDALEPHVRAVFRLDHGEELRFNDPRKFGRIYLMAADGSEHPLPWAHMGPEPLEDRFTPASFGDSLRRRTALIKPLLLGQQIVAGLGNIYVDEALFAAGIHPERRADSLSAPEIERLHASIGAVLAAAISRRGTTFDTYVDIEGRAGGFQEDLLVFRRANLPCPRCGSEILKLVVGGRGTHICPHCQRK